MYKEHKTIDKADVKQQIREEIGLIEKQIQLNKQRKSELEKMLLELDIAPFKIGEYALVKIPSGKSYKEQKCLLECNELGILYARPIKANGELSSRHFSIIPTNERPYSHHLKEVK